MPRPPLAAAPGAAVPLTAASEAGLASATPGSGTDEECAEAVAAPLPAIMGIGCCGVVVTDDDASWGGAAWKTCAWGC